jgi:hypothetical protein
MEAINRLRRELIERALELNNKSLEGAAEEELFSLIQKGEVEKLSALIQEGEVEKLSALLTFESGGLFTLSKMESPFKLIYRTKRREETLRLLLSLPIYLTGDDLTKAGVYYTLDLAIASGDVGVVKLLLEDKRIKIGGWLWESSSVMHALLYGYEDVLLLLTEDHRINNEKEEKVVLARARDWKMNRLAEKLEKKLANGTRNKK